MRGGREMGCGGSGGEKGGEKGERGWVGVGRGVGG